MTPQPAPPQPQRPARSPRAASLQRRLSLALAAAIAVVALAGGVLSFLAAYEQARELQDDVLLQVAALMQRRGLPALQAAPPAGHLADQHESARLVVQRLGAPNPQGLHVDQGGALPVPAGLADGLHTLELQGETFRVLIAPLPGGERLVVAQEADLRDELAREGAVRTVLPFAVLMPVLLLVAGGLVSRLLRPLAELAQDADQRGEHDLRPMPEAALPAEAQPFVAAINRLLARLAQSLAAQRRFVADAAHELRSPLTALSLQAERLAQVPLAPIAAERLGELRSGVERTRSLLEQLLNLARAQSAADAAPPATPLEPVLRRVLEDLGPLAQARGIDLGLATPAQGAVLASELDLYTLVRNLADNAIRYTPQGGRVDLGVLGEEGATTVLYVEDTGPGIAAAERGRVFDPFYRILGSGQAGSGLGLSIVQAIATRLGARLRLDDGTLGGTPGLRVSVELSKQ